MTISLNEQVIEVSRVLKGNDYFVVNGGDWFKVETTGAEILNETVPEGKQWGVVVTVRIEETEEE